MKRKIALVVCLIMIATMVMTVLVACGEKKYSINLSGKKEINDWVDFSTTKDDVYIVELSDDLGNYNNHDITVTSDAKLESVELQSKTIGGIGDWTTFESKSEVKEFHTGLNMSMYYQMDQFGNVAQTWARAYRLKIVAGKKANVNVHFERHVDFKEITAKSFTQSYCWKPGSATTSDEMGYSDYETISHLFLSVSDARLLGRLLKEFKLNQAIKTLSADDDRRDFQDAFFSAVTNANSAMEGDSFSETGKSFLVNLLVQVTLKTFGFVSLEAEIKALAKELVNVKTPQVIVFERGSADNTTVNNTHDYNLYMEEIPTVKISSTKNTYILPGAPGYLGSFTKISFK